MGVSKFSNDLKVQVLNEIKEVGVIKTVADKHGISPKTIHNWLRSTKNKVQNDQNKELRELTKLLKDRDLEILVLKELLKKTYPRWQNAASL